MVLERITYASNGKKIVQQYPSGPFAPPLPPVVLDILETPYLLHESGAPQDAVPETTDSSDEDEPFDTRVSPEPMHSLKQYLRRAWIPAYWIGNRPRVDRNWCYHPELRARRGTRTLLCVRRIQDATMRQTIDTWIRAIPDFAIPTTSSFNEITVDLALPSVAIADLADDDVYIMDTNEINYVTDLSRILKMFTLRTVETAYKLLCGPSDPLAPLLKFHDLYSSFPIEGAKFDLLGLPGSNSKELSMVLLIVPYWEVDYGNLQDFTQEGMQAPGSLDLIPGTRPPYYSTVLWAMLWEVCKHTNCRFFAVTTYDCWTFGNFSDTLRTAQVTEQMKAPVFPKEVSVTLQDVQQCLQPNVLEFLLFWLAAARDPTRSLVPLPSDPVIQARVEAFFQN